MYETILQKWDIFPMNNATSLILRAMLLNINSYKN